MTRGPASLRASHLVVGGILLVGLVAAAIVRAWIAVEGSQAELARIDCGQIRQARLLLGDSTLELSTAEGCSLAQVIGTLQPVSASDRTERTGSTWRYAGRFQLRSAEDLWLALFMRRSGDERLYLTLRRFRGNGWGVVGTFDADPVRRHLRLSGDALLNGEEWPIDDDPALAPPR